MLTKEEMPICPVATTVVDKARKEHPELTFYLCDVNDIQNGYDMLFSNACLQWLPDHASLLPKLMNKLNTDGVLAVQLPMNQREPPAPLS